MNPLDEYLANRETPTQSITSGNALDDYLANNDMNLPDNVTSARSEIGNTDNNGYCERFAEKTTMGKTGLYGSAIEAWNNYAQNGKATSELEKARPGDLIYFNPDVSNQGYGHVGVLTGKGNFISATDNGVQEMPLSDWEKLTGQKPLGIVPLSAIRGSN